MKRWPFPPRSLLWRVLPATFAATVVLFTATAWLISRYAIGLTTESVADEVQASLREFEFIWKTRADSLARVSRLIATMSDVRNAFGTRDPATIRDTAGDLWSRVATQGGVFLVYDPEGNQVASLGGAAVFPSSQRIIRAASPKFPAQVAGFLVENGKMFYAIITPVYVQSAAGSGLLNVLLAAFAIDDAFARDLSSGSGGTEFVFEAGGKALGSTLNRAILGPVLAKTGSGTLRAGGVRYQMLSTPLMDFAGKAIGELNIMRSLAASDRRFAELRRAIALILLVAVALALLLSYLLARQIIEPIHGLDKAAAEIASRNYGFRLQVDREDELGRLARTFNGMCDSIESARTELIAQERLNTVGRLASSMIHDLRNPLAAIYGGSEMLVDDGDLPPAAARRLSMSIYRAARHIREMLRALADSALGTAAPIETCKIADLVEAACELLATTAEKQGTRISTEIPASFELAVERTRMERVFLNLVSNSLESLRQGGEVHVSATETVDSFVVSVDDTGAGVPEELRAHLFLPFASGAKRNGLGLGLALSRQTVLDHGGEMWLAEKNGAGACFCVRLPKG